MRYNLPEDKYYMAGKIEAKAQNTGKTDIFGNWSRV